MAEDRIARLADAMESAWETIFGGPFADYAANEPESAGRDLGLLGKELWRRSGLERSDVVTWLRVDCDEDGVMVVKDLVEGEDSEPIATVMREPSAWADDLRTAIVDLMKRSGMEVE